MSMVRWQVSIEGTSPALWHKFSRWALPLEKKEKRGVAGNDPDEWRDTCLVTREGQLYFEKTYVFGALVAAAKHTKRGRMGLQSFVSATLMVEDEKVLLDRWFPGWPNGKEKFDSQVAEVPEEDDTLPVYLDVRGVVNPSTRGRNIRYRVSSSPGWQASFVIAWENTIVSSEEMEVVLNDAGNLAGLGSARKIGYGRFKIVDIENLDK